MHSARYDARGSADSALTIEPVEFQRLALRSEGEVRALDLHQQGNPDGKQEHTHGPLMRPACLVRLCACVDREAFGVRRVHIAMSC